MWLKRSENSSADANSLFKTDNVGQGSGGVLFSQEPKPARRVCVTPVRTQQSYAIPRSNVVFQPFLNFLIVGIQQKYHAQA